VFKIVGYRGREAGKRKNGWVGGKEEKSSEEGRRRK
jgi:hypothetical protein